MTSRQLKRRRKISRNQSLMNFNSLGWTYKLAEDRCLVDSASSFFLNSPWHASSTPKSSIKRMLRNKVTLISTRLLLVWPWFWVVGSAPYSFILASQTRLTPPSKWWSTQLITLGSLPVGGVPSTSVFWQFGILVMVEFVSLMVLLLQQTVLDVLMNFLALTIITEFDDYLFATLFDDAISKLIKDGEAEICGKER